MRKYVEENGLNVFFSGDNNYIEKVAEKVVALKDDPKNYLNKPDQITGLTRLAMYQPVFYCGMALLRTRSINEFFALILRKMIVVQWPSFWTRMIRHRTRPGWTPKESLYDVWQASPPGWFLRDPVPICASSIRLNPV